MTGDGDVVDAGRQIGADRFTQTGTVGRGDLLSRGIEKRQLQVEHRAILNGVNSILIGDRDLSDVAVDGDLSASGSEGEEIGIAGLFDDSRTAEDTAAAAERCGRCDAAGVIIETIAKSVGAGI